MLNKVLPPTIRITGWCPVDRSFSARYSCCGEDWAANLSAGRVYRYYFLLRNYDVELMRSAVKLFEGEHDFRNFCRIDAVNVCDFTRTVFRGDVVEIRKGYDASRGLIPSEKRRSTTCWPWRLWVARSCGIR